MVVLKKAGLYILSALLILCVIGINGVFAQEKPIKVFLNGERLQVAIDPIIEKGTTLVPMRSIFEGLGMQVTWDSSTKTITGKGNNVTTKLTVGQSKAYVNGVEVKLAVPAKIVQGNTLVPLRFIAESAGCEVQWDGAARTIKIKSAHAKVSTKDADKLYTVKGTGKYADYMELKGFPDEDKYRIFFQGDANKFHTMIEDLRKIDLNEVITWKDNGVTYKTKRSDLYKMFSNLSHQYTHQWLLETFDQVYLDWAEGIGFSEDATRWVQQYFKQSQPNSRGNITLTPDMEFEYADPPMEEPSIEEVIGDITKKQQKIFEDSLTEEQREFIKNWIGEWGLEKEYKISFLRDLELDNIKFYKLENNIRTDFLYEISNVPRSLNSGEIITGNGVRYQYVQEDSYGKKGLFP